MRVEVMHTSPLRSPVPAATSWQDRLPLKLASIALCRQNALAIESPVLVDRLISAWRHYDEIVFDSWISNECRARSIDMSISASGRSKLVGARLITKHRNRNLKSMQIRLSPEYIAIRPTPIDIFGLRCVSAYEIALALIEHEIVHQIEMLIYGNSSCRKPLFSFLARGLFGHNSPYSLIGCGKSIQ